MAADTNLVFLVYGTCKNNPEYLYVVEHNKEIKLRE